MTPLQAAQSYCAKGYAVIPVPHRSKNPGFLGWQNLRLKAEELPKHFDDRPQNIGMLMGTPSGDVVDVDLDHPVAVKLASAFLRPTNAIFGRTGKPRSHYLYRLSSPIESVKFRSKANGMLVEIRSTGAQTVVPPGIHPSGETIGWETENAEPALITPEELIDAIHKLVEAVKRELNEEPELRPERASDGAGEADDSPCLIRFA